jgi:hypothetical protein
MRRPRTRIIALRPSGLLVRLVLFAAVALSVVFHAPPPAHSVATTDSAWVGSGLPSADSNASIDAPTGAVHCTGGVLCHAAMLPAAIPVGPGPHRIATLPGPAQLRHGLNPRPDPGPPRRWA